MVLTNVHQGGAIRVNEPLPHILGAVLWRADPSLPSMGIR
jgi:hypothetical protein